MIDRASFLKLSLATAAGGTLGLTGTAAAQTPGPAPQGEDEGFVQFVAVGALVTRDFYAAALTRKRIWSPDDRRRLSALRGAERNRLLAINPLLGPDGATADQFPTTVPAQATRTRGQALRFAARLHELVGGVCISGASLATDPGTRGILARIGAGEGQSLATIRTLQGAPAPGGLIAAQSLDSAGIALDRLIAPSDQETPDQEPT